MLADLGWAIKFHTWSWLQDQMNGSEAAIAAASTFFITLCVISWSVLVLIKRSREGVGPLPPGPRGLPLIGSLPFIEPDLHRYFSKLARIYGPIMKVPLGTKLCVVISSPGLAKEILKDHDAIFANRDVSAVGSVLTYGGIDIAFSPYGPKWRMMRKVCAREMMSPSVLDSYYNLRRREVNRTVHDTWTKAGHPINVSDLTFQTSFNVITSMMWGGTLDWEEGRRVGRELWSVTGQINDLLGRPNISDVFPIIASLDVQGLAAQMMKLSLWLDRILQSVIDRRLKMHEEEREGQSKDFLQLLLQLMKAGDPKMPLTLNHIKAILLDMVLAGSETTSTTIEWAITELIQHPESMKKAQQELKEVVGQDNSVEESHLSRLCYLDAIIKEVLRLHPPLVFLFPRSPDQSCTVGGYTIPKGTQIMINTWDLHRDPEVWDNPLEFRPERFYNATCNWDYTGKNFSYLPFGSGRRICVGLPMAERMLVYVFASLLHSFDWQLPEGAKLDLTDKFGLVVKKKTPLVAIPTPRFSKAELYSIDTRDVHGF